MTRNRAFRFLRLLLLLPLLLGGCGQSQTLEPETSAGIPIDMARPGECGVDFEFILEQVESAVAIQLPGGQYHGVVFRGDCAALAQGEGEWVFDFIQVEPRWFPPHPRVWRAVARLTSPAQSFSLSLTDDSDQYPNLNVLPRPDNRDWARILTTAAGQIQSSGIEDCQVVITQLDTAWSVLCDPLNDDERKCAFSIDAQ